MLYDDVSQEMSWEARSFREGVLIPPGLDLEAVTSDRG